VDAFADEEYVAGASFSLLPETKQDEVKMDPDGDEDYMLDYQDGDDNAGENANHTGDNPDRPAEPTGPPSGLTPRQRQRLQQLLESGEIARTNAAENDAALWKRYRDQSRQAYRTHRRLRRRAGEWQPDQKRGRNELD